MKLYLFNKEQKKDFISQFKKHVRHKVKLKVQKLKTIVSF